LYRKYTGAEGITEIDFKIENLALEMEDLMAWVMMPEQDDHMLDDLIDEILEDDEEDDEEEEEVILNKDGSIRRVKRLDYSRGPKLLRRDPNDCYWMWLIQQVDVADPSTRNGKNFRRWFRVPYPLFEAIVEMCIDNGSPEFMQAHF
jgi:hypothetical protein